MKWMIASDIHGSAYYCDRLAEAFVKERADRLLLLGDILYHGPRNDLPRDYAPKRVAETLNGLAAKICCVRGNCDAEVDQMMLSFPIIAECAVLAAGERLVYATHGTGLKDGKLPPLLPGDILLHGHTHIPRCETIDGITFLNPGSVSIPKNGSAAGYMTLENGLFLWKDTDGNILTEYRA